jgi:hypothetical protein
MPRSGTTMTNASIPYLMAGRNLGSFCSVEVGEYTIVNHREVFTSRVPLLGANRLAGCDVEHTSPVPSSPAGPTDARGCAPRD